MAQGDVPTKPPNFRTLNYGAYVRKAWGDEWHKKETGYEFSNGKKFDDTGSTGSFYRGTGS